MSLTDATKIAQSAGLFGRPDDEFRQSWFSTLMGRTTQAVLLVFGYLAALGAIWGLFGDDLKSLHSEHPLIFYGAIGGPLLLVLLFSVIPTIRRGIRERRLHPLATRPGAVREGYYRLRPYEETDAHDYARPDGSVDDVVGWLKGATDTVLYLSGASGTGKTSLVNAGVIPALRAEGWQIVTLRGMANPLSAIQKSTGDPVENAEVDRGAALEGLRQMAGHADTKGLGPILIVLDQFEEYLILDGGPAKQIYTDFLQELATNPIPQIRLLHVFREDYRALLFKEGFPDYLPRLTGFELAPFNRREAERFLREGPQALNDEGYDALFAGLDRIEDARGLYRPITLNMIGYVLGRESKTLTVDPGKLIETYLKDCIGRGTSKDFAPAVLQSMITREGTKEPRTIDTIASVTGVEPWQIKATLVDLENDRLVRPLPNELWEISHDFLARLIGQVLGRNRIGWFVRNATPALAMTLVSWVIAAAIAMPAWNEYRVRDALDTIAGANMLRDTNAEDGGLSFVAKAGFNDENLQMFGKAAGALNLKALNLNASSVTDLNPIRNLSIERLSLSNLQGVTDLSPLAGMNLRFLDVYGTPIRDPAPLLEMPLEGLAINLAQSTLSPDFLARLPIEDLTLRLPNNVRDLEFLRGLKLRRLEVQWGSSLRSLDALDGMPLEELVLSGATALTDLSPLRGAPLKTLNLNSAGRVNDLEALRGMPLEWLDLTEMHQIDDLGPLEGMPLKWLNVSYLDRIDDLSPLSGVPLEELYLANATGITDLSPLEGLPLRVLSLTGLSRVKDLDALSNMPLESIYLDNANSIRSLRPLAGNKLREIALFQNDRLVSLDGLEESAIQHLSLSEMPALRDISAISEMPLETLSIYNAPLLTDLSPLSGLKVTSLYLVALENVEDLNPLAALPLRYLTLSGMPKVTDLTPLTGMQLQYLTLNDSKGISDLSPLTGMPLETLELDGLDRVHDLSPLKGMPLYALSLIGAKGVTDLSPLKGSGLRSISLSGATGIVDLSPLKGMQRSSISAAPELLKTLD
ncbi:MAG: hypothetical protein AAGD13_20535 [Pseudomonadota bacterium]